MLTVDVTQSGEITEILLAGELESLASPRLDQQLAGLMDLGNRRFLIRFARLTLITSAGLRVFLSLAKKIQKLGGKLVLCEMSTNVRSVFDTVGFTNIMTICATAAEGKSFLETDQTTH